MDFLIILMGDLISMYIAPPPTLADCCLPLCVNTKPDLRRGSPARVPLIYQLVPSLLPWRAPRWFLSSRYGRDTIRLHARSL